MLVDAAIPAVMALDIDASVETALHARAIAAGAGADVEQLTAAIAGTCLVMRGDVPPAVPLLEEARSLIEGAMPPPHISPMIRHFVGHAYILVEWYARAARLYDAAIHGARAAGMPGLLPFPLAFRAELYFRTGNWHRAFVDASESVLLAEQTGQWTQLPHSLAVLARIEAGRGDEVSCRANCARALAFAREHGSDPITAYAAAALGQLELGLGRIAEAVAILEPAVRLVDARGGSPAGLPLHADLVEAFIRADRRDLAERALVPLERWAAKADHVSTRAVCARCRGLLAANDAVDDWFGRALELHEQKTVPFARARTELAYGERLRRSKRLVEAREPLRAALNTFEELLARPWAERARTELRAAREVPRDAYRPAVETLTAQELHVARVVAGGATNREAAAALFLSPKTIDFHLGNVYRKLGVRSRTQLSRVMRD
jgi:ATP/maltotriose-dependent transcriptional regulator MalT